MTDQTAAAKLTAAYLRGYSDGVDRATNAHDALISIIPMSLLAIKASVGEQFAEHVDEQVMAAMIEVRRITEQGPLDALTLWECERALAEVVADGS
jgi:hypothetical protein